MAKSNTNSSRKKQGNMITISKFETEMNDGSTKNQSQALNKQKNNFTTQEVRS